MKHYRTLVVLIAALLLVISALPVAAQETDHTPEELALIEYVSGVYESFFTLDTVQATQTQHLVQDIGAESGMTTITIQQIIDQSSLTQIIFNEEGNLDAVYAKTEQSISQETAGQPPMEIDTSSEMILVDGQLYMRFANPQPGLPAGWFDPGTLPGNVYNFDAMMEMTGRNSLALYPISPETVVHIKELEPETIDGVKMRVFEIEFSAEIVLEQSGLEAMFNQDQADFDIQDMLDKMGDDASYTQKIWIGSEDTLIYRAEFALTTSMQDIEVSGSLMDMDQNITGTIEYFGFNEPLKIEAPTLGE